MHARTSSSKPPSSAVSLEMSPMMGRAPWIFFATFTTLSMKEPPLQRYDFSM